MSADALEIARLDSVQRDFRQRLDALFGEAAGIEHEVEERVRAIVSDVRCRGDAALLEYTAQFDRHEAAHVDELRVSAQALERAYRCIDDEARNALEEAAQRLRAFHEHQLQASWSFKDAEGSVLGQEVRALDRVGLYAPGGKAAYPSSVLMGAVPAQVAGVEEIILAVPAPGGQLNELVLAAAVIGGVHDVISVGGAQAVAALAFGTQSVTKVDKIVGPGNIYVATAKRLVFGAVGIDMIAGPSEILVVCDGGTPAHWIAMDLFSQAEHDEDARAVLICPDVEFLDQVESAMRELLPEMERTEIIRRSLSRNGALIKVRDLEEAMEVVNLASPEHLELSIADAEQWLPRVRHAGAIFLGRYTSEALGDYCAGPNHVLPTSRTARFSSPLGVYDFQKRSSVIGCTPDGARRLGRIASVLARGESLTAHARSAELRMGTDPVFPRGNGVCPRSAARPADWFRPEVRSLSAYHVAQPGDLIKLNAMENPYTWPEALIDEWLAGLRRIELNRYPDPSASSLKRLLCQRFAIPDDMQVLLGNGSDELIQLVVMGLRAGARVLAPRPTFVMYRHSALSAGLEYVSIPLAREDFRLSQSSILDAVARHQPAVVFLAYPNNPTGNLFDASIIDRVIAATPGLVILDEAYAPFAGHSYVERLGEFPNLLVMGTLSKLGLAGLRLGYLCGPATWLEQLEKLRLPYNVNVLTQASTEFALRHYEVLEEQTARIREDRDRLYEALVDLDGVKPYPSAANFVLLRIIGGEARAVDQSLRSSGVLVKNLDGSDDSLDNCLRVTVGTPDENRSFLEALAHAL